MINVTQTFLPPFEEYTAILKRAWDKGWITNNGELVRELEAKLKDYLGVKHLLFCCNGTIVLQMAIKALGLTKEIITTPFSYVATANAIAWEGCTPVFVDIEPETYTIDPEKIERAITENTEAILATHVYGFPCRIDAIQAMANKYGLKVIYDGAHAFGCTYKGQSLLSFGDISTCSFHATKLFHTVEGGCVITNNDALAEKLTHFRQFGHIYDEYFDIGINGKNSELHAAMGLAIWPYLPKILAHKRKIAQVYSKFLPDDVRSFPVLESDQFKWNFSYQPVIFSNLDNMMRAKSILEHNGYWPRRYFYPSLNTLPFLAKTGARFQISESVAERVLCLPNGIDVNEEMAKKIACLLNKIN